MAEKVISKVWMFESGSNPDKSYQTLIHTDGTTSCNCPGWTRRTAADGTRSCKHTRDVDMNVADRTCTSSRDYGAPVRRPAISSTPVAPISGLAGKRKISV